MNAKETFVKCECCENYISTYSPPPKKSYENAEIHIDSGMILLPKKIVEKNHKKGFSDNHAKDLSGYYCCPECLFNRIRKILKIK